MHTDIPPLRGRDGGGVPRLVTPAKGGGGGVFYLRLWWLRWRRLGGGDASPDSSPDPSWSPNTRSRSLALCAAWSANWLITLPARSDDLRNLMPTLVCPQLDLHCIGVDTIARVSRFASGCNLYIRSGGATQTKQVLRNMTMHLRLNQQVRWGAANLSSRHPEAVSLILSREIAG